MKKAKVILIILIMLILVVSIVSCQKQNSQKGNDTRSDQDQADVGDCSQTESGSKQELADESPSPGDSMETKHVNTQLQKITFVLDWTPNTNHSGLFLAQQQGYYAEEGLDVDFQESDMNFIEMVATGSAPFGIASQEQVLQARSSEAEIPIVAVAAILQHNTSGFASPAGRGITTPRDFEDKTYSGWGTELELAFIETLMKQEEADFAKVNIINQSASNYIAAMESEADFAWIYWGWDGINCELQAYPLNFILLQDIDPRLDFYSPTIITNETVINDNPELIRRFLRATAKGYSLAVAEPDKAVEAVLEMAPELDRELVSASQKWLSKKYIDDASVWGTMELEIWLSFKNWMLQYGVLENDLDPAQAFTNDYLP
ncbi:MAG: ABC transporter substrate-binding protein [Clostridiaceae bacterium]|nr:ABC transporter substrate-binding protein [Clostridiaceae bacterium]